MELSRGSDTELQALAQEIRSAQEREIAQMREQLGPRLSPRQSTTAATRTRRGIPRRQAVSTAIATTSATMPAIRNTK